MIGFLGLAPNHGIIVCGTGLSTVAGSFRLRSGFRLVGALSTVSRGKNPRPGGHLDSTATRLIIRQFTDIRSGRGRFYGMPILRMLLGLAG